MARTAHTLISSSSSETSSSGSDDGRVEYRAFSLGSPGFSVFTLDVPRNLVDVGKVAGYGSVLDESRIRFLARAYNFPLDAEMIEPRPEDRACAPPAGFVTIYEDSLRSGLHLPLPEPFAKLQTELELALGQIMPNSFRHLTDLGVAAIRRDHELTAELIHELFAFKRSGDWYYASSLTEFKGRTQNKVANWHSKYFFCRHGSLVDLAWRAGRPRKWVRSEVDEDLEIAAGMMASCGQFTENYGEDSLAEAGLSPFEPQTMVDPAMGETPLEFLGRSRLSTRHPNSFLDLNLQ